MCGQLAKRLDLAAQKYAEAVRLIGSAGSVVEAARFIAKHHPAALAPKVVPDVYEEFRKAKEAENVSSRYLQASLHPNRWVIC